MADLKTKLGEGVLEKVKQIAARHLAGVVLEIKEISGEMVVMADGEGVALGDNSYGELMSKLPADECRYAVYWATVGRPSDPKDKVVFITWCPLEANPKMKMRYPACAKTTKSSLLDGMVTVQSNDDDEKSITHLIEAITGNTGADAETLNGRKLTRCKKSHEYKFSD